MRRLTYVLQFYRPPGATPQPIVASSDCVITITPVSVTGEIGRLGQYETAVLQTTPTFDPDNQKETFTEKGMVTFGDAAGNNRLHFSSIGLGHMDAYPCPEKPYTGGTVMWKIDKGEGFFKGATGAITSNFLIDMTKPPGEGELLAYQFGVVYLP